MTGKLYDKQIMAEDFCVLCRKYEVMSYSGICWKCEREQKTTK